MLYLVNIEIEKINTKMIMLVFTSISSTWKPDVM